jgi:preprotein translocase subunit SecD
VGHYLWTSVVAGQWIFASGMRYSQLFPKTLREAPKDAVTVNHKYLVRGGFIDQLMAGSWTLIVGILVSLFTSITVTRTLLFSVYKK